jgi:hypothetical protein
MRGENEAKGGVSVQAFSVSSSVRLSDSDKSVLNSDVSDIRTSAASRLYTLIPAMQDQFPDTSFAKSRFSMGKADLELTSQILDKLEPTGYDAEGFNSWVYADRFQKGRSPRDRNGPESLGLLVNWAEDYADVWLKNRAAREDLERRKAEIEARRAQIAETWRGEEAERERRREDLREHPEQCEQCGGKGSYGPEDRYACNCPAGDAEMQRRSGQAVGVGR